MSQKLWEGARSPEWTFELLDSKDQVRWVLDGVGTGTGSVSYFARLGGDASITISDQGQAGIDFMNDRLRVTYDPGIADAEALQRAVKALEAAGEALTISQEEVFLAESEVASADSALEHAKAQVKLKLASMGSAYARTGTVFVQPEAPPGSLDDVWVNSSLPLIDLQTRLTGSLFNPWLAGVDLAESRLAIDLLGDLEDASDRLDLARASEARAEAAVVEAEKDVASASTATVDLPPIPWGVYLFTSPETSKDMIRRDKIGLLSKMAVIDTDAFPEAYSAAAGTNCIAEVVRIIQSTGETRISATPSDATLTNPLVFEAGESKLSIINDLLTSAGYAALWCDGSGQFRVEPYLDPGSRPHSWHFTVNEASIVRAGASRYQDLAKVPNYVIVVCPGNDEEPAIVGHAWNRRDDSPFSVQNRNGRVITRREEVGDISSEAEATALAERFLLGGESPVAKLTVTHGIVPLEPGNRVTYTDGDLEIDAVVTNMEVTFGDFASQCKSNWNEVTL